MADCELPAAPLGKEIRDQMEHVPVLEAALKDCNVNNAKLREWAQGIAP